MSSLTGPKITYNDFYDWEVSCQAAIFNYTSHGDAAIQGLFLKKIEIPFDYEILYDKSLLSIVNESMFAGIMSDESDNTIMEIVQMLEWSIFLDLALKSSLLYENQNNNIHNPTARYQKGHLDCIERTNILLFPKPLPDKLSSEDFFDVIEDQEIKSSLAFLYLGIDNHPVDKIYEGKGEPKHLNERDHSLVTTIHSILRSWPHLHIPMYFSM